MKAMKISEKILHTSRRNLPHWQMGDSWYFVTFKTKSMELPPQARGIVTESIVYFQGKRYDLSIAVVMPDHVHLLFQPLKKTEHVYYSLHDILKPLKGVTARRINLLLERKGALWLAESYDRIVRNEKELIEKHEYIKNNALKSGLTEKAEDYTWLLERANFIKLLKLATASCLSRTVRKRGGRERPAIAGHADRNVYATNTEPKGSSGILACGAPQGAVKSFTDRNVCATKLEAVDRNVRATNKESRTSVTPSGLYNLISLVSPQNSIYASEALPTRQPEQ